MVRKMVEEGRNLEGITHRDWKGRYQCRGQQEGGDRTGDKASETGSWRRALGADRDLGSRPRAEIQRLQDMRWRKA